MNVSSILVLALLLVLVLFTYAYEKVSFFQACDKDEDRILTKIEVEKCFGDDENLDHVAQGAHFLSKNYQSLKPNNPFGLSADRVIALLDRNGDGKVQLDEYAMAVRTAQGDSFVDDSLRKTPAFGGRRHDARMDTNIRDSKANGNNVHNQHSPEKTWEQEVSHDSEPKIMEGQSLFHLTKGREDMTPQMRGKRASVPGAPSVDETSRSEHELWQRAKPRESRQERLTDEDDWGMDSPSRTEDDDSNADAIVTLRNGTVMHVSKEEMLRMMQNKEEELAHVRQYTTDSNGAASEQPLGNVESGEVDVHDGYEPASLEQLQQRRPDLARFIDIARWAVHNLQAMTSYPAVDHAHDRFPATGYIEQLRSLPAGGSINRGKEDVGQTVLPTRETSLGEPSGQGKLELLASFELYLELSLRIPLYGSGTAKARKSKTKLSTFELHITRDPSIYRYPHLAVTGVWQLSNAGVRKRSLEVPQARLARRPYSLYASNGTSILPAVCWWYLGYGWDVGADLLALLLDSTLDYFGAAALSSPSPQQQLHAHVSSETRQSKDLVFVLLMGFAALALGGLYLIVLPCVWWGVTFIAMLVKKRKG